MLTPQQVHDTIATITAAGQAFEVESRNIAGRSLRAYRHAPATLVDVLQGARAHAQTDAEFLVYEGRRIGYAQFYSEVDALAATLQHDYGVVPGERVAIAMRNCPEWSVGFTAAALIGAIVVPINSWGKREELVYALRDCGARCLICDEPRHRLVAGELATLGVRALLVAEVAANAVVESFDAAVARGFGRGFEVAAAQPEDECLILYTSGSTGFPKGVRQRHVAVTQSLMNMYFLGFLTAQLEGQREFRGGATRETPLLTVPLFHATGLLSGLIMPLQLGHKVVMMYKWDSLKALQLVQQEKVTGMTSVPAIIKDFLAHPDFDRYDVSSLIRVSAAGAATPAGLPELMRSKLGDPSRSTGYGMTETMAATSTMSGVIYDLAPASAGIVSPIIEMRLVADDGRVLDQGKAGEIQLRSVLCTPGYWQKPEADAKLFTSDGWMHTGDVGLIDASGFLYITGRIKEIVIRGGENIFPGEVEDAAYHNEAVQEAVVFGVDDPHMGEELAMVCYPRPGTALDASQLRRFLDERLAGYKVPKYIAIAGAPLPRNASEKLHKLNVKAGFLEGRYPPG
ncbi:MAG TPA: class I adenylate-forming enzyme family protein [Pseudomonadales bacterium]|nr:class I adenylate-forming enzyme family protein [Pseudomonadales bacterium]